MGEPLGRGFGGEQRRQAKSGQVRSLKHRRVLTALTALPGLALSGDKEKETGKVGCANKERGGGHQSRLCGGGWEVGRKGSGESRGQQLKLEGRSG